MSALTLAEALDEMPTGARVASPLTGTQWRKRPDGLWVTQRNRYESVNDARFLVAIGVRNVGVIHQEEIPCRVCKMSIDEHDLGLAPEPGARRPWLCPPFPEERT